MATTPPDILEQLAAIQQQLRQMSREMSRFKKNHDEALGAIFRRQIGLHAPHFSEDWFSGNIPHLVPHLTPYAGQANLRFLEIGCFEGRSTLWFLETFLTHATATIDCIDVFDTLKSSALGLGLLETFQYNIQPFREKVQIHVGLSQERLLAFAPNTFDLIYVDGSHLAEDVYQDGCLAFPLLKSTGLMVFDDYLWKHHPDPQKLPKAGIDRFLAEHTHQFTLCHQAYQVILQKH